jgi:hypothetical protein
MERMNVTDVVHSVREQVLAQLRESGCLSAPPAPLQTWLVALLNDDNVAAELHHNSMDANLTFHYLATTACLRF